MAQARAAGTFTAAHQQLWDAARARLGDGPGTRTLIEVLLLHRRLPAASVTAGISAALGAGTCSPTWSRSRPASTPTRPAAGPPDQVPAAPAAGPVPRGASVITLPRRAAPLPADGRPAPSVAAYDQLLARGPGEQTAGGA